MPATLPPTSPSAPLALHRFDAPAHWRTIELLSDVHLQPEAPRTFDAWRQQMLRGDADAVLILGDLFEAWIGDDARDCDFERACLDVLREASSRRAVALMHGNRDFLLGEAALLSCGAQVLPDATVLHAFGRRAVLTHGDALCLADTEYQRFRALVRSPQWQAEVLKRPLAERRALARRMRDASARSAARGTDDAIAPGAARASAAANPLWADVDPAAALQLLDAAASDTLVHGHTHRPGRSRLSPTAWRHVLSDWDFDGPASRGNVLRLDATGIRAMSALALGAARA
ncbi:MAG: UDP-2,3-diacylglucosamine diphosphatase [Ideonella sp.]|nr:UDP-2,3-diacylglucosamine diphosphatase [Ideonella sp.]MCC7459576.1 UDP-2,3-diacylglucosamine diphosphatase [Nitrospira sp.]